MALTILSFSTGAFHSCAVFDNNKMKCWGSGIAAGASDELGDTEYELGDSLPYFDAGTNVSIKEVTCGYFHTCALLISGDIKCMGGNLSGQVGIGSSAAVVGPSLGQIGDDLPILNIGTSVKVLAVAAGGYHTCVIVTGKKVKCFGQGERGQLGYENLKDIGKNSTDMGDALAIVDLGTDYEVSSLHSSATAYHGCAILSQPAGSSQRIKCWGLALLYQLGYGDNENRGDEENEMGDNLPLVEENE